MPEEYKEYKEYTYKDLKKAFEAGAERVFYSNTPTEKYPTFYEWFFNQFKKKIKTNE